MCFPFHLFDKYPSKFQTSHNMFSLFHANHDRQDHVAGVGPRRMSASYGPDEYVDQTYLGTQRLASLSGVDDTVTDVTVTERSIQVDATVGNLARQLSSCLAQPPCPGAEKEDDLFNPKQDSDLDPYSANFSSKAWARKIVDIASRDANKTLRKAGIAYRNLSVHGFGSDTDFQATVSNVFISGIGMLKDAMSSKKKGKIQILSGFDGLVESGEMLIVLGPPGR
jgi:ATP-binding cassette, subfamily G (WHITE), member 2, PDR